MKNFTKTMVGVTLLEIMLVLAIAAMIIVMSVRYYQSASVSQQANMALQQIQAITAAADNIAMGNSSYSAVTASLSGVVGANNLKTPTNQSVTVTSGTTSYSVTMPLSAPICASVLPKLKATAKISNATPAPACPGGTLSYTYDSTK